MNEYRGQSSITVQAPIEQVYAYLADFSSHSEWVKNISRVTQITPGVVAVGTVFRTQESAPPVSRWQSMKMMIPFMLGLIGGAKPYSEAEITALEPMKRIAWKAGIPKGGGFFNLAEWEFCLEAQGGTTRIVQRFHWKPQNPTAERMVSAAGTTGLESAVSVNLARLKERLEQSTDERKG